MIEVREIVKSFGKNKVLNGMSFSANKGEITCLIGINGSGKTAILNAIKGLTPIKSGNIFIDGKKLHKKMYEQIAYIPDAMTMVSSIKIGDAFEFMNDFIRSETKNVHYLYYLSLN